MKYQRIIQVILIVIAVAATVTAVTVTCTNLSIRYIDIDRDYAVAYSKDSAESEKGDNTVIAENSANDNKAFDTVYVTKTGTKYHLAGCTYLKSSVNEISLDEAEEKGYEPCSKCVE